MAQDQKTVRVELRMHLAGWLTIAFIVLKLVGVIDWSWLWVLSPLWLVVAWKITWFIIFFIVHLLAPNRR